MAKERISNSRSKILMKLRTATDKLKQAIEDLGFVVVVDEISLDGSRMTASAGTVSIEINIYDMDDISISMPKKTSDLLDIAQYASFKTPAETKGFFRIAANKIKS